MVTVPRWAWVLIKRTLRCQRYCDPDHHPYELRQDRDPGFLRQGLLPCAGDSPALAGLLSVHIDRAEGLEDR